MGLGRGHSVRSASREQETLALLTQFPWDGVEDCKVVGEGGYRALSLWVTLELFYLEFFLSGTTYSTKTKQNFSNLMGPKSPFVLSVTCRTLCKADVIVM